MYPLIKKPIQVSDAVSLGYRRFDKVFVCHLAKIVGGRNVVAVAVYKVSHHCKKRVAVAGRRIGKEKMQHAQHQRALVVDERLVSSQRFGGSEAMTQADWPNIHQPAFAPATDSEDWFQKRLARGIDQFGARGRSRPGTGVENCRVFRKA